MQPILMARKERKERKERIPILPDSRDRQGLHVASKGKIESNRKQWETIVLRTPPAIQIAIGSDPINNTGRNSALLRRKVVRNN